MQEHYEEVEPKEAGDAAAGAGEASEGDDHEEDANGDDGSIEELVAVGGAASG